METSDSLTGSGHMRERCPVQGWHPDHVWIMGGKPVECDGMNTQQPRYEGDRGRCCGDPNCPCDSKPGWTRTGTSMDYEGLQ